MNPIKNHNNVKTFDDIKDALKYGVLFGCTAAIAGALFVNLRIINQHLNTQDKKDSDLIGLSLKNRYETAYCLNTPEEHKYYYEVPYHNGHAGELQKKYYPAPKNTYFVIGYSAMVGALLGAGFGASGLISTREKTLTNMKQNSRSR